MNLVKNEKLENNSHELQFSIDAEAFNAAIAKAFKREVNTTFRASARAKPLAI